MPRRLLGADSWCTTLSPVEGSFELGSSEGERWYGAEGEGLTDAILGEAEFERDEVFNRGI